MLVKERVEALRSLMKEKNIDMYFIPSDDDHMSEYVADHYRSRAYISGFTGSAGMVIVTPDEAGLWTDGRYFVQAENQLKGSGITLFKMRQEGVPTVTEYMSDKLPVNGVLGFDGKVVSAKACKAYLGAIQGKNGSIKLDEDLVGMIWDNRPEMPKDKAYLLGEEITGKKTTDKINAVREVMSKDGIDALVTCALEDVCYLLNIRGNDVPCTPVIYGYVLVTKDECNFYVDSKKLDENVCVSLQKDGVTVKEYDELACDLGSLTGKTINIDSGRLNAYLNSFIGDSNVIVDKVNPCVIMRAVKNEVECKNNRAIHILDGVAVTKFIYWLKNTIKEREISELEACDKLLELRKEQNGFIEPSFNTIGAYGANAAMMHYSATKDNFAILKDKGFFLVDSGGTYFGGTTDITRTISLGELSALEKKYYTAVLRSHVNLYMARFLQGTTGYNLDMLARGPIWNMDIDYQCGTGHGVGYMLSVHEGPHGMRWGNPVGGYSEPLVPGMVITDEPGIYLPGDLGIRIENELVVVKGKKNEYGQFLSFDNITFVPYDRDSIDVSALTQYEIKAINEYHAMVYEAISPYMSEDELVWLKGECEAICA